MLEGEPIGVRFPPKFAPKTIPQPKVLREKLVTAETCCITGIFLELRIEERYYEKSIEF